MRTNRKMLNLNLPPIVEAVFALKALHLYKSRSLSFLGQSLPFGFLFLDSLRLVLKLSLPERKPGNPQESETTRHSLGRDVEQKVLLVRRSSATATF